MKIFSSGLFYEGKYIIPYFNVFISPLFFSSKEEKKIKSTRGRAFQINQRDFLTSKPKVGQKSLSEVLSSFGFCLSKSTYFSLRDTSNVDTVCHTTDVALWYPKDHSSAGSSG